LDKDGEEVDEEERFDAAFVLEKGRSDFEYALDLVKPFLDGRLALVSLEDLGICEASVIGEEGVHAVGLAVVFDGVIVNAPFDGPPFSRLSDIGSVWPWTATFGLPEGVLFELEDLDLEVSGDLAGLEDFGDTFGDGGAGTQARSGTEEPGSEIFKVLLCTGETFLTSLLLMKRQ